VEQLTKVIYQSLHQSSVMALRGFAGLKRILDHTPKASSTWCMFNSLNVQHGTAVRTLFTKSALGTDGYEKQRARTQAQFTGMVDKFRDKMKEFTESETKQMIFTEDLKNMVHLIENKPEDLALIVQMIKRFNTQNRHLRFGNFVFGPVVMRMFHFLNEPKLALEAYNDPELHQFFEQITSAHILFDLLYKNGMYDSILETFQAVQERQLQGQKFPRNVTILVFAACYKLNTVQSYETVLKLLTAMKEIGAEPVRRCISYAASLALHQNAPQVALEILSNTRNSNYVSIRNLKLLSLAELDRPDDCLPILRFSIEFDSSTATEAKRHSVLQEVLDKIQASVERLGNQEVTLEFTRIQKALVEGNQASKQTMAELLEMEIEGQQQQGLGLQGQRRGFEQMGMDRSFRQGQRGDYSQRNPSFATNQNQRMKRDIY